jgi:hypothetical protein
MTTALAPVPENKASPLPAFNGAQMTRALAAYRELQADLDKGMPDQIIRLDGKPFRKKGYWRAVGVAFNLSVELVEERREVFGMLPSGGEAFAYLVTYRAATPTGRSETGDGACTAAEKSVGRMRATEHNVRSHAHTRAFNRAVSNLVGFGEVSAEEVEPADGGVPPARSARVDPAVSPSAGSARPTPPDLMDAELPPEARPASPNAIVYITDIRESLTKTKKTRYTLTVAGGANWPANANTVMTFNTRWAELARECQKSGAPVKLGTKRTEYGLDVASLERVDDQGNPLPLTSDDIPSFR